MTPIKTKRLELIETQRIWRTPAGNWRCVFVNAWHASDPFPILIVGSALLVECEPGWMLSHLLIEDEYRREGYGTELVAFYEDRLGTLGACWASDAGKAFGKKYIEQFGVRPHWQVERPPEVSRAIDNILAEQKWEASHA